MIQSVKIINDLEEEVVIQLSDGEPKHGLIIQSITGLGVVPANINMAELATLNGSLFNSARQSGRNVVFTFLLREPWDEEHHYSIEDARRNVYKYFPIMRKIKMEVKTDRRTYYTSGHVETCEPDIFSKEEKVQVSILCEASYFYSDSANDAQNEVSTGGVIPKFEFPFSNESLTEPLIEFGEDRGLVSINAYYDGDYDTGGIFRIDILDDLDLNFSLVDGITNEHMDFDERKISLLTSYFESDTKFKLIHLGPGDSIYVSTVDGNRYVMLYRGRVIELNDLWWTNDTIVIAPGIYNLIGCISLDSSWLRIRRGANMYKIVYTSYHTSPEVDWDPGRFRLSLENRTLYGGI